MYRYTYINSEYYDTYRILKTHIYIHIYIYTQISTYIYLYNNIISAFWHPNWSNGCTNGTNHTWLFDTVTFHALTMKSWPSFLTITLLRSTKHVLLKFWWFIDLSYFDVLRLRDRNRGSFLELVVSDMDSSSLTWNDQPGLISPANILGIYESMSPAMGKTHLARQLEVQCKQEHQRPMLSRKQAQEVLPVVKSQRLDICQMWFLLQITNAGMFELELLECFNTLCMWWNWLILKAMHFFFRIRKKGGRCKFLGLLVSPPLTVLQE